MTGDSSSSATLRRFDAVVVVVVAQPVIAAASAATRTTCISGRGKATSSRRQGSPPNGGCASHYSQYRLNLAGNLALHDEFRAQRCLFRPPERRMVGTNHIGKEFEWRAVVGRNFDATWCRRR